MTKIASGLFLIFLAYLALGFAAADGPYRAQTADLDVAGVKIGMSRQQAMRAAIDRLAAPANAVQSADAGTFSIRTDRETLTVHLTAGPADAGNRQAVDRVTYEMPWTPSNEEGMKRAALQRYGAPSNGTRGFSLEWCRRSVPDPANPGVGCLQAPGPVLKLSGTTIELTDPQFSAAAAQTILHRKNAFARF